MRAMSVPRLLTLLALLQFGAAAQALPSDSDQPIHIQADAAVVDDTRGSSVYTGNVVIDQGTLHIKADEVRILTDENDEVVQIIARNYGSLAHFEQQPKEDEDKVLADATTISYFVQEKKLHLTGSARMRQTLDLFEGELLRYDVGLGILNLDRGADGGRIKMIIHPKDK